RRILGYTRGLRETPMKDVLDPRHRAALRRFVGNPRPAKVLLAFDYDGVLAPLVKDPSGARMRPSTRRLLAALGRHYPTAVVSGRAWKDTARFVEGTVGHVVGNHGFELDRPVPVPRTVVAQVRRWREQLERELAGVPGVYFEDKRSTLAIHYGLSRAWRRSEAAVYEAANRLEGTRLVSGKKVLNVLPRDFPTKGDAIRSLLAKLRLEAALYAGDDVTDEDAFAVGPPLVFGVHVGPGRSLAEWRLRTQDDIERLLKLLLELRERPAKPARRRAEGDDFVSGEK
ncbi:MAG TPA: trehalose-phosphatase, partial [Anaeromyxobacteraceae bacterium]|nr:trehalose-phosphatase [Anaeromyxobacteraceae bacterium]